MSDFGKLKSYRFLLGFSRTIHVVWRVLCTQWKVMSDTVVSMDEDRCGPSTRDYELYAKNV